jgi:hypothetical protein
VAEFAAFAAGHLGAQGLQREGGAGVGLAAGGDVLMAQHLFQPVVGHQQLGQFQRPFDLCTGVAVPGPHRAAVAVGGQHHLLGRVLGLEPGEVAPAGLGECAGVVHLDADGVGVQAAHPRPVADAGMPGHHIEGQ